MAKKPITQTSRNAKNPRTAKSGKAAKTGMMTRLKALPTGFRNLFNAQGRADTYRFLIGMGAIIIALFMLLAFTSYIFTAPNDQSWIESGKGGDVRNMAGILGAKTAHYFIHGCFGLSSFFIPIFMLALGVKLMRVYRVRLWKWFLNCTVLMVWLSITLCLLQSTMLSGIETAYQLGGLHGKNATDYLIQQVGTPVTYALIAASAICYFIYLSNETINVVRKMMKPQAIIKKHLPHREKNNGPDKEEEYTEDNASLEPEEEMPPTHEEEYSVKLDFSNSAHTDEDTKLILETPTGEDNDEAEEPEETSAPAMDVANMEPYDPRKDLENYRFPQVDLLKSYPNSSPAVDMAEQNANKDRIIAVLRSFGVKIESIKATIGPTITLYEITPGEGVRINKIRNLEDDIALSLSALGIRIIAPIPGKGTIGIEVPNKNPRIVPMESIINSRTFQDTTYELPIALGKTITNEVFMVDLAKMPHLLVAGATGQGKSVGLNAIITSLLYKKHPAELKLVMVDPKKVEFSVYTPIVNHFLAQIPEGNDPIITDVTKVVQTLKSLCCLMDHRYDLLRIAKVRNIKEYNAKFKARQLNPENGHEFMPYIVVIIDEFGDLIMTAGKEVELPIARIAQLARAVGIHMVIATQRPTTNIITGTIKANFPARMAFKVMSRIDSQTILDRTGANQLVGKGDMLFLAGNEPVRVQCAFVDTPEVEQIANYIAIQQGYLSPYELPEQPADSDGDATGGDAFDSSSLDPMFEEAARLIVIHQQGSTSLIQRKFSIGYNRAGRLMDQLEKAGIVGPTRGAKPREVYCADETELQQIITGLR